MIGFATFNAAICAIDVAIYAHSGNPFCLGAAVFSGFVALIALAVRA